MKKQVLLTGATGFIGTRMVEELTRRGYRIRAIVRKSSNTSSIRKFNVELVEADLLRDSGSVADAIEGCDQVFHLAAETRAIRSQDLVDRNVRSMKSVVDGILRQERAIRLVYVSSLAAAGPSSESEPLVESRPRNPVSWYGRSKAACEELVESYADQIPTSIVRPPIVLGENDANGLLMFRPIDSLGIHFVPGFRKRFYSVIYVGDLCDALIEVAENGETLATKEKQKKTGQGIYFATSPESLTFAELGRMIGRALGKKSVWVIPVAMPLLSVISIFNEMKGRLLRSPQFLNRDKYLEGVSGSWWCSGEKLRQEVGFAPTKPLADRIESIVANYRSAGWLKPALDDRSQRSKPDPSPASREKSYG